MTTSDWKVEVRDVNLNRVGELDDYQQLEMLLKFNDVSTWRLQLSRRNRLLVDLLTEGAGIIVYRNGQVLLSGFWTDEDHSKDLQKDTVTVSGVDDTAWLGDRKAYPQPNSTAPPYSTSAQDTRSGLASTVIRQFVDENGGLATDIARRIPGLNAGVSVDPLVGASVTGSGRWQLLLPLCQELAKASEAQGAPVGFRIVQDGAGLLLDLYEPADKSGDVVFSLERGNLAGFTYKRSRPTMTYAHVGGDGEGTARTIVEKPNGALLAQWGRIEGDLVDSRNGNSAAELVQAADQALAEGAGTTSLSITPIDLESQKYGEHYGLGDKVTVLLDSLGPRDDVVVADAYGWGTSITTDYLIAAEAMAPLFPPGTRVVLRDSSGTPKDPGVRVITTNDEIAFGFVNLHFYPPASASTEPGDHLVAIQPPAPTGSPIQDLIREVAINLTPDGEKITPAVGNTNTKINPSRIFATVRRMAGRITNLERR